MNGKNVCAYLKSVRQKVAEANGIDMEFPPCHYEGDCKGTCPRCEAEVVQLERELSKRQQLSKRVAILGIAAGLTFAALPATAQTDDTTVPPPASDLSIDEFYIEGELPDLEEYAPYERAQFPGGQEKLNQYLAENINYPSTERHWNGTIWIMFIIEKDGSIGKVEILSGGSQAFDDEVIRVIKNMPKWIPAQKDGKPVRSYFDIPIRFVDD